MSDWLLPSWPPDRQMTCTGVRLAAIPLALASASESGNRESCSPWISSVGAAMCVSTLAGLDAPSSACVVASGCPACAAC